MSYIKKISNISLFVLAIFYTINIALWSSINQSINNDARFRCFSMDIWIDEVSITNYYSSCGDNIIIPNYYKRWEWTIIPVTTIKSKAFDNKSLRYVILPDTIKNIESFAFSNNFLTYIEFPQSLEYIWDHSFYNNDLKEIYIENNIQSIWINAFANNNISKIDFWDKLSINSLSRWIFKYNHIQDISIPDNITKIDDEAFYANDLKNIKLNAGLKSIWNLAFAYNKLSNISIPNSVISIWDLAFDVNTIDNIEFESENKTKLGRAPFNTQKWIILSGLSNLDEIIHWSWRVINYRWIWDDKNNITDEDILDNITNLFNDVSVSINNDYENDTSDIITIDSDLDTSDIIDKIINDIKAQDIDIEDGVFIDINNSFAKSYIEKLYSLWLISGYGDGTFRPNNNISRAEFLKISLKRAKIDYNKVDTSKLWFIDVDRSSWVGRATSRAIELDIIDDTNNTFRPDEAISRAEAIKLLLTTMQLNKDLNATRSKFTDVDGWAIKYIERALELEIISNDSEIFRPNELLSRAETSKIIINAIDRQ